MLPRQPFFGKIVKIDFKSNHQIYFHQRML
jgi:hypothetical protein